MNNSYKMKYASYIATLTPEQRKAELMGSLAKNLKRSAAGQKGDEHVKIFSKIFLLFFYFKLLTLGDR